MRCKTKGRMVSKVACWTTSQMSHLLTAASQKRVRDAWQAENRLFIQKPRFCFFFVFALRSHPAALRG